MPEVLQPPAPPPFSLSLTGPLTVRPGSMCTWTATASGVTGNTTYEWYSAGALVSSSQSFTGSMTSSGQVLVNGTNQGSAITAHLNVTVSSSASPVSVMRSSHCLLVALGLLAGHLGAQVGGSVAGGFGSVASGPAVGVVSGDVSWFPSPAVGLALRGTWWTGSRMLGVGPYVVMQSSTRRWLFLDVGLLGTRDVTGAWRPAVGMEIGARMAVGSALELRLGAGVVRDSHEILDALVARVAAYPFPR